MHRGTRKGRYFRRKGIGKREGHKGVQSYKDIIDIQKGRQGD